VIVYIYMLTLPSSAIFNKSRDANTICEWVQGIEFSSDEQNGDDEVPAGDVFEIRALVDDNKSLGSNVPGSGGCIGGGDLWDDGRGSFIDNA
jgi:hypothetical protein